MMKKIFASLLIALAFSSSAQITTTKVAAQIETPSTYKYDSTENFLGKNVSGYLGQELYLKGVTKILQEYSYEGFLIDYTKSKYETSNIYKGNGKDRSSYQEMNGKYFKVLEIIKHPKAAQNEGLYGSISFLKLEEKESKDIVYYQYDYLFSSSFPFIVVGYFEKIKPKYIGTQYVLRGRNWIDGKPEMYDMNKGTPVDFSANTVWKCVDVTIEEKYYKLSAVLQNDKGEQVALSIDNILKSDHYAISKSRADIYKKKFGEANWDLIIHGNVKPGMTKEMCEISWDKPKSVNETLTAGKKTEQWVYKDNYLYFDNGVLTVIQ